MAYHRPIAYIKKDLEQKEKALAEANKETAKWEKAYNSAMIRKDPCRERISDIYEKKRMASVHLDREVQALQKELKTERNRLDKEL